MNVVVFMVDRHIALNQSAASMTV